MDSRRNICIRLIHPLAPIDNNLEPMDEPVREAYDRAMGNIVRLVQAANKYRIPVHVLTGNRGVTDPDLAEALSYSRAPLKPCRNVIYAGFCADFSMGTLPTFGFANDAWAVNKILISDATLIMPIGAHDPNSRRMLGDFWPAWHTDRKTQPASEPSPWTSAQDIEDQTKLFCERHATLFCDIVLSTGELLDRLEALPVPEPEDAGVTIVTVPMPFDKGNATRQHNAIHSWTLLDPCPEIILLGNEKDVPEMAERYDVRNVPDLGVNELGDLSMRSIFRQADRHASSDVIAYVDTDVILMHDFVPSVQYVAANFDQFLIGAGRYSARISEPIDFSDPLWEFKVWIKMFKHHQKGSDYAVYRKGFYHDMPDFSIGRGWWDGWRMGYALRQGAELINAEQVIRAVHQDHGLRWAGHAGTGRNQGLMGDCQAWVYHSTKYLTQQDIQAWIDRS